MDTYAPLPAPQPKSSGLAITSLVLGIISLIGSCITGIPAIIFGHVALSKIKKSGGQIGGAGLALTGLILGYVFTAFSIIYAGLAVPTAMKALGKAEQVTWINNAKNVKSGLDIYASTNGGAYPATVSDLIPAVFGNQNELDELLNLKGNGQFTYVPGYTQTSPGNLIIIFSPVIDSDKRIVGRLDSSIRLLDNASVEQELKDQGVSLP